MRIDRVQGLQTRLGALALATACAVAVVACNGGGSKSALPPGAKTSGKMRHAMASGSGSVLPIATKVTGSVTEYTGVTAGSGPHSLTFKNGDVWFTEQNSNAIGVMSMMGFIEYPMPWTDNSQASDIVVGPDNRIWFSEYSGSSTNPGSSSAGSVGIFDSCAASFAPEIQLAPQPTAPRVIVKGPDGNVWVGQTSTTSGTGLASITPAGVETFHSIPHGFVTYITAGPDGNMWYTANSNDSLPGGQSWVGVMSTSGTVLHEYTLYPSGDARNGTSGLNGITVGGDNNVWVADAYNATIAKITTAGQVTLYPISGSNHFAQLSPGPNNTIWVADIQANHIGELSIATGGFTWHATPSWTWDVNLGPDGNMWFAEPATDAIAKYVPGAPPTAPPTAVPTASPTPTPGPAGSYSSTVMGLGPVAYYRLDETSGTVLHDTSGNARDVTLAGTVGSAWTLGAAGLVGGGDAAVAFAGTDGGATAANAGYITSETIVAWVQRPEPAPAGTLMVAEYAGSGVGVTADDHLWLDTYAGNSYKGIAYPSDGARHMIALYRTGGSAGFSVDGAAWWTTGGTFSAGGMGYNIAVGASFGNNGSHWNGTIDEVSVFNGTLTSAQLAQLYQAGTAP